MRCLYLFQQQEKLEERKQKIGSLSWEDNREVFKSVHGEEVKKL